MTKETILIKVAGTTLHVPIYGDAAATSEIVEQVTNRFREIEASSDRIDTQAFALLTAVSFAAALADEQAAAQEDTKDILVALARIQQSLQDLLEDLTAPS